MDDPSLDEIIKEKVAIEHLRESIWLISQSPAYPEFRTSKRIKLKAISSVLKKCGSYINSPNSYGETAIHAACELEKCDMDFLQELLKHGGQVDKLNGFGDSSLHLVARKPQNVDIMQELLKYSQNPNISNINGETPLFLAVINSKNDFTMVYDLLEHGADFRIADNKGRNSLHAAIRNPHCQIDLVKKFLQKAPIFVNCQDNFGITPLHLAVRYHKNSEIVKELLNSGANPNRKNKHGRTPLHSAALKPNANVVEMLLEHEADVNVLDFSHLTPLHLTLSVTAPSISVIQTLIKYGANVNAVNQCGMNVLFDAVCNQSISCEIIKLFLENGANPDFNEDNNILVHVNQRNLYHISKLLIPHIIIRLINSNNNMGNLNNYAFFNSVLMQFKDILLLNTTEESCNFKEFFKTGETCIMEMLNMSKDFICGEQTLLKFVIANCIRVTPQNQNVPACAIDKVLLCLRNEKYPQCRHLIYTSVKRHVLINRLSELGVSYKVPGNGTLKLNYFCVNSLANYLSKDDVINMIFVFGDEFKDLERPGTSKRSAEKVENVYKKICK